MMSTSRVGLALLAAVGPLVAGCFAPRIENGAFACEPRDDPPCPTGFYCFNLRCVSYAADVDGDPRDLDGDDDLAMSGGADMTASSHDLAGADLAGDPPDLSTPPDLQPPNDLKPPNDIATGVCGHAGAPCTTVAECCSNYCRSDGICIGG